MSKLHRRIAPSFFLLALVLSNALQGAPLREADDVEVLGQLIRDRKIPLLLVFESEHFDILALPKGRGFLSTAFHARKGEF